MPKTNDEIAQLSEQARQVWDNPLVQNFMRNHPQKIFAQWVDERDPAKRELLWNEMRGAEAFARAFMEHLAGGKKIERQKAGVADTIGPII